MLTLHCAPKTISVAVAIALEEAGLAYDTIMVDFAKSMQTSPAYLEINPKGRVPALITAEGILTETGAILEFIAATTGRLMPDTPVLAARVREVMYYVASTMHVNHAHKLRGARWADDTNSHADMTAKVPQTMATSCTYLENCLNFDPFISDEIGIADAYLYVVLCWLSGDGVDIADYPKLARYHKMMTTRASVQAVITRGLL